MSLRFYVSNKVLAILVFNDLCLVFYVSWLAGKQYTIIFLESVGIDFLYA